MLTRKEFTSKIINLSMEKEEFRNQLIKEPRKAIEVLLKTTLPESLTVNVHEENTQTLHIVLPPAHIEELSATELEAVSGGACWDNSGTAYL